MKAIKRTRALVVLALAACLLALTPTFALAAPSTQGTEANPADAAITKTLQMPQGTATPTTTFNFTTVAKSVDGSTAAADVATMPTLATVSLPYAAGETPTSSSGGIDYVSKQTSSLFTGITGANAWPHAGVYVYTITETSTTWSVATETMAYSPAVYDLYVYVANGTGGNLFVEYVYGEVMTVDNSGQTVADKVDPSPGTTVGTYSDMVFTNTFTRKSGPNPLTDASFTVSKAVSGSFASQTKLFDFTLNITQAPFTTPTPLVYKAYVLDIATNTVVTSASNYAGTILTDPTYGAYVAITAGTSEIISLTHGQKIVVVEAHVGSGFSASEAAAADYTPSIALISNGVASTISGSLNTALATGSLLVTEGVDTAAYTNAHATTTPTGIALNDLPFIGMLAVGLGAVVAFFVLRSRKRTKSAAN